ncbi:histone deacetylase HDT2 isoform X2 [Brachypodium distachyon]|uniref:C2H2-type domain-containing protein n=1 Tax=Brachypodium distachyon TaxID=15368 RepID=A0A0Q3JF62_BRADI|nr:histone deacetylase HDT2 isoform X2 [Brachypodium distachyon]KQK11124.1 hypothetical protein BRADI_2g58261v3 [Brachypodium distachyon]|eukprot:XP_010232717.1 histone deacetylase HDT2 isoform X2 [Brachypodium distachyon]
MTMIKFWGVEVKPGQTVSCDGGHDHIIHVSQAALVETKKGSGNVVVSTKIDDQKVIIGTLSAENHPQILCDLNFQKKFELSHNSETASVFVCGYQSFMPDEFDPDSSEDEDEVEAVNNQVINNVGGIHEVTAPAKDGKKGTDGNGSDDDSDDDLLDLLSSGDDEMTDDDSSSEEDDTTSEEDDTSSEEDDISSEESSSDEEDEETLKEPEISKKRVAATALKAPASDKKAKIATPSGQKTDDKKATHVTTPHPAKQAKTPANSKPKKSPKSTGGTVACKSCSKTFGSDAALKSHEKAKHE